MVEAHLTFSHKALWPPANRPTHIAVWPFLSVHPWLESGLSLKKEDNNYTSENKTKNKIPHQKISSTIDKTGSKENQTRHKSRGE